jgi:hypothetical protein
MKKVALGVIVYLLLAGGGLAHHGGMKKITLTSTPTGKLYFSTARAVVAVHNRSEMFGVQVRTDLEDGDEMFVWITTVDNSVFRLAGRITLLNGYGELRLVRGPLGQDQPVPVMTIKDVSVVYDDILMATGSF